MGETEIKDPITLHLVICMAHARIWMNKHKPLLVVADELEGKAATAAKVILFKNMTDDFQEVQSACLSVALNRPAFKLLIDYWRRMRVGRSMQRKRWGGEVERTGNGAG